MGRPRLTPEQRIVSAERKKELHSKRDRRKTFVCDECAVGFKMPRFHRKPSRWCDSCRILTLRCDTCSNDFTIDRKTFVFRGARFCSRECCLVKTSLAGKKGKESYSYKHGLCINRLEYTRKHRRENKDKYRFYTLKRLTTKRGLSEHHSFEEWQALKERFGHMCLCCKRLEPEVMLTADHIVPLSKGGVDTIDNIQPLCKSCNSRKHARYIDYISQYYETKK